jgi:competence protein ComEC
VLAGLAFGILTAELFHLWVLGLISLGLGLFLLFVKGRKDIALFSLFLAAGILLTVPRIEALCSPDYGSETTYVIRSARLVQDGVDYCVWQGKVLEPKKLAGTVVLVYSEQYASGTYCLQGRLLPPVQYRNPGQGWHYKRKVYAGEIGVLKWPQIRSFLPAPLSFIERARVCFRNNIAANLVHEDSAALALALTTGDRSLLRGELKNSVFKTGVGHTIAMSGMHVGILMALALTALQRLGLGRGLASIIGFIGILLFLLFAGPSPSLVRAVLMSGFGIAALLAGKEKIGVQALQWTCFAMLLFNPLWLFDYAFILSFIATFVCLAGAGAFEKYLAFLPAPVRRPGSVTIIIQLVALPLSIGLFGSSSWWAPAANLVIIPLMPLLTGGSLLAGLIPGTAGRIMALPAFFLLRGMAAFLTLLNQFPLPIEIGGIGLGFTAVASMALLLHFLGLSAKKAAYFAVIGILITAVCFNFMAYGVTSVWFLDVGQGDSILIREKGQWILVDCGDSSAGEKAVLPTLKFLGVNRLSALILTHPHADHAGGAEAVLANLPAEQVISNFQAESISAVRARALSDLAVFSHNLSLQNLNDTSLLISFGGDKVLLTGDIEAAGERLYWVRIGPHSVLKVAHHGSNTSSSPEFLAKVQPQVAIVSCGLGNQFGMPGGNTLENLAKAGARVYRTDLSGCVRVDFWPWGTFSVTTFVGR